jgi:hypothetical protein
MNGKFATQKALLVFAIALAAPWLWFHVGVTPPDRFLALGKHTNLAGLRFVPEPMDRQIADILKTTNLISGRFESERQRFSVFAADWLGGCGKSTGELGHTPDICWVATGYKAVSLGQPSSFKIRLGAETVVFECRVFQLPDGYRLEMVAWSSILGGLPLEEGFMFQSETTKENPAISILSQNNARMRGINTLIRSLQTRKTSAGGKQFVRFSTAVTDDWENCLSRLEQFAASWLYIDVQHSDSVVK